MHPWWPRRARAQWLAMSPARRRRARLVLARIESRYRGLIIGQLRLTRDLRRRYGLQPGPAIDTVRELTRRGLVRRRRIGPTTLLWIPLELRESGARARRGEDAPDE